MPRGRKQFNDEPVKWTVHIPRSISDRVEQRLSDPLTGKPIYGARAKLLTKLLREWLEKDAKAVNETQIDLTQLDEEI